MGQTPVLQGTIARLVRDRGFGFLSGPEQKQYFFHTSGVVGTRFDELLEGDQVSFEPTQSEKGPRAEKVVRTKLATHKSL